MLANGIKLGYKTVGASDYTDIPELKKAFDIGVEQEKVENTRLNATVKHYENGIGDAADLTATLDYENDSAASTYRVMRKAQESNTTLAFKQTLKDGTTFEFEGQPSVTLKTGKLNDVLEVELKVALQSDIDVTDPTI